MVAVMNSDVNFRELVKTRNYGWLTCWCIYTGALWAPMWPAWRCITADFGGVLLLNVLALKPM